MQPRASIYTPLYTTLKYAIFGSSCIWGSVDVKHTFINLLSARVSVVWYIFECQRSKSVEAHVDELQKLS